MGTKKNSKRADAYERQRIPHEHGVLQRAKRVEARAAARHAADAVDALEKRWGSRAGALDRLQYVAERLTRLRAEEQRLRQECEGEHPGDLVFDDGNGGDQKTPTMTENSWRDQALETAELLPMTIHDLRHTAASLAVSAAANVKTVQRMLGHASAAMTLDTYSDLFDDDLDAVAVRLHEAGVGAVGIMWDNAAESDETAASE